ncbi:amidase [Alcaligenes sp. SORT26]|uniref:amidase n=1 Tax=Alcaligenes sp. SORT26 TaxID=2813780 RepID=UPI001FAFD0CD|nr:amidase [Alcaligenes sp. SORT26]
MMLNCQSDGQMSKPDSGVDMTSPMSIDLIYASADELRRLYQSKVVSPVDVARATLDAVDRWNPIVNAYCYLNRVLTLQEAAESEARWIAGAERGPLDGIPYGVKDLLLVRGLPTGYGSSAARITDAAQDDAPAVARMREAGAVLVGKTTTSEFGWKGTADSPLTGVTRNIWDFSLTSGGSSGGAATALAAGMGTLQIGTDGGGSTRIPASFCGVTGMKATFGGVPAWPAGPMLTLSNVGPMARSVADLKGLLSVMMQADPRDWNSVPLPRQVRAPVHTLQGLRIGLHLDEQCSPEVRGIIQAAADKLQEQGAHIVPTELPLAGAKELITAHWEAGTAWLVNQVSVQQRPLVDEGLRRVASKGQHNSLSDYYQALIGRQKLGEAMLRHFAQFDLILTPTVPILPFEAGREAPADAASQNWLDWNPYTYPFNLTRQPAISLPAGISESGLPVGLQLVAGLYQDEWLVDVAQLVEDCLHVSRPRF